MQLKQCLEGKIITLHVYIKKEGKSKLNYLSFHFKKSGENKNSRKGNKDNFGNRLNIKAGSFKSSVKLVNL